MSGNLTSLTLVIGICEHSMGDLRAARKLPGGEHTDVDDAPIPACYI